MFVSSIFDDLKTADVLGTCDDAAVFARLTDAVRLVSNMGLLDPSIGTMSLCVCDGCVTLPSEVETVMGVNQSGFPTLIRDEWFQYHVNGPGSTEWQPWTYTDVLGEVCTYKDPSGPVSLIAEVESAKDSNKALRVYGWDVNGKRIYTANSAGDLEDGFLVPTVYGFSQPNPSAPLIARIDRIQKAITNGFIKLIAINADGSPHTQIGYYRPEETVPRYQRIRVPCQNWLKIKYRKRNFDVRSTKDWINVDNREVLVLAVKAVNQRRKNNLDLASQLEAEAGRILAKEAEAKRPNAISPLQIIFNSGLPSSEEDRLFY